MDLKLESDYFKKNFSIVAGIDEAGRGPLAGPAVAACVAINSTFVYSHKFERIGDSKKLSPNTREKMYELIMNNFDFGVGICDNETIDRINILQATFLAMKKAINSLNKKAQIYFVDGSLRISNFSSAQVAIPKGDSKVFSIAAASILAKVTRDNFMLKAALEYPLYGFEKHKGYGTKDHINAILKHGPCKIHRKTFAPLKNL